MSALSPGHTLERHRDEVVINASSESLALVDLETYPVFLGKGADYFDMMAHLSAQMQALTAIAWKAPTQAFRLRICLVGDDQILEQTKANRVMVASGNVRCYGELCLATHERLFDSARNRRRRLLRVDRESPGVNGRLFHVPPGIYSVSIFYHVDAAHERTRIDGRGAALNADYTVLLRHYPFPPPRVAPIRLSSGFFPDTEKPVGQEAGNAITSHQRIW